MATVRLVASNCVTGTNVTVTDPGNMYYNTDHSDSYCTIRGQTGSTTTRYFYIKGFNFNNAIPSNATVTSFSVKLKAYRNSYESSGSSYRCRLCSNPNTSSTISNTTLTSSLTTTPAIYTFPNGALTWSDLVSYGSNFSIQIRLRNTSTTSGNYPYVYVYGAEIEVNYTLPTNTITWNCYNTGGYGTVDRISSGWSTTGSESVSTGNTVYFKYSGSLTSVVAIDNGNTITNWSSSGNEHTYTITSINADHDIRIYIPYHVTRGSAVSGVTFSSNLPTEYIPGADAYTEWSGDITNCEIYDNGISVKSSTTYDTSGGQYVIHNIQEDHDIVITEISRILAKSNGHWIRCDVLVKATNNTHTSSWRKLSYFDTLSGDILKKSNGHWSQVDPIELLDQNALYLQG